jgi:N-acetylneuraminate lyase
MKLTGLIAATHTPFDSNGELNLSAIPTQAEWLLKNQIHFAFICGSTGESHSLSLDERMQMAKHWVEVAAGTELKVIIHVGSNCLRDAAALAEQAQRLGATAISALAPSYFKPADVSVLIDSMKQIASHAPDLPFYYYDIPALTNVRLSMPQLLQEARSRIPTLVGLKFTNEDYTSLQTCLAADGGRWDILWGVDESLLAALSLGVNGAVGSSYNFAPQIYHRMMAAYHRGDLTTARQEQLKSIQLIKTIAGYGYLPAAKHVMELLGVPVGTARLPLSTLRSEQKKSLQIELENIGFFEWANK